MADFEAPSGPPPPKVPEGWVARWNDQYKEWFYVNTYTKKSQWDKPTEPARPPHDDGNAPAGPPPSYTAGDKPVAASDAKVNPYDQPQYGGAGGASSSFNTEDEDAKLARQLQAEEDARARGSSHTPGIGGAAASYGAHQPQHSSSSSPFPGSLPVRPDQLEKGKSFLGKLFGGKKGPSGSHGGSGFPGGLGGLMGNSHGGQHQQHGYGHGPAPPPMGGYASHSPQPGYGGYPPQHGYGGYPPQQGYGGHPPPMGGGYYGQPGYGHHNGRPAKSGPSAGMMAGGAALGVGAGLVGGMMVADAINDNEQEMYQEGYQDGAGGEDFGGDDFGGDF